MSSRRRWPACTRPGALSLACLSLACTSGDTGPLLLTADVPLHLEDHLDAAIVTGSEAPANAPQTVEWRFDQPQPDWKAAPSWNPTIGDAVITATGEALRVTLTERTRNPNGVPVGGIYVRLPDWDRTDWGDVIVRAKSDSTVNGVNVGFNLRQGRGATDAFPYPFQANGQNAPVVRDGTVQTYRLRVDWSQAPWEGPWRELGIWFRADEPGSIDVLSVSVVPRGEAYRDPPSGVRSVPLAERIRRSLYVHAPARVAYRVRVPPAGRLGTGLGVLGDDAPVTFRVRVEPARGEAVTLLDETWGDAGHWGQRSVDLSAFADQTVTLVLETEAAKPGTVALWSAPTLSGVRVTEKPNVIFYVIDGGAADQMSVFGYNRRTTPNLERLALEGALFEHAYSNASWSKPSTTGFMTSLHVSALGSRNERFEPLPVDAHTMAERFHEAGYQTGVFTSNPWAGRFSSLERFVDVFRDQGVQPPAGSSVELHREFREWREAYPGEPYWVHFQTTDVHGPHHPLAPFAGLFAPPELKKQEAQWDSTLRAWRTRNAARLRADRDLWKRQWAEAGVDRVQMADASRALYDETLAHQDHQLGRLVERLKESGEWGNTLLVIGADHSVEAAAGDFITTLADPPGFESPWTILRASISHVPLLFVWPGHIAGGQRFSQPVSMIDVLPTVLELAGLPLPEVLQGQSLAPLLQGRDGWRPHPVIFDEVYSDVTTGEHRGELDMIDGRWGASLWIGRADTTPPLRSPLLLYDVWNDPFALKPMNEERPDLVEKYTRLLEEQWEAHKLLATRFTRGDKVELTPEQLETLRALGYIR